MNLHSPFTATLFLFIWWCSIQVFPSSCFLSCLPPLILSSFMFHFSSSLLSSFVLLFMILPRYLFTSQPRCPPPLLCVVCPSYVWSHTLRLEDVKPNCDRRCACDRGPGLPWRRAAASPQAGRDILHPDRAPLLMSLWCHLWCHWVKNVSRRVSHPGGFKSWCCRKDIHPPGALWEIYWQWYFGWKTTARVANMKVKLNSLGDPHGAGRLPNSSPIIHIFHKDGFI